MRIGLTLLFLLILTPINAQKKYTIHGKITDATNGETLEAVKVSLKNQANYTETNSYGLFHIKTSKKDTLEFVYPEYKTLEFPIAELENNQINIQLLPNENTIEEVVYKQSNASLNVKSTQMGVLKISAKEIKETPSLLGEADPLKALTLLPGVTNSAEGSGGINVRGGASDQNLILLDEAVLYNSDHLFGFLSVINPDAIKNVSLYKGGIPAEYGGRISSVFDIQQRDGNKKYFEFTGGIGALSSRFLAEGPLIKNKASFLVGARASYINLFLKLMKNKNNVGFYDFNTKLNYTFNPKNRLFLSGYFGRDQFRLNNLFNNSYGNASFNLRWNRIVNENLFTNTSLMYNKYNYFFELDFLKFDWNSYIENINFKYDATYFFNENIELNAGIYTTQYDFNPGKINPTSDDSSINSFNLDKKFATEPSLYAEVEHKINAKLSARYGLRWSHFIRTGGFLRNYENNLPVVYNPELEIYEAGTELNTKSFNRFQTQKYFNNLEPRLSFNYLLNNDSSLKASYQRMTQYIHLISNTNAPTPLDVWAPSGRYIKPQKSNQYSMGYYRLFNNNQYQFEAEIYYKDVQNRIDYIDGSNIIANNTIETEILPGDMRSYGIEFYLKKNIGKLKGWISYTLSNSEQKITGRTPEEIGINNGKWYATNTNKNHDLSITALYDLNQKWKLSSNFILQSGRPTTYPVGSYTYLNNQIPIYGDRNSNKLPTYHRLDLAVTYKPNSKNNKFKSEWVFSVYNLYNRKNATSINFETNEETGENQAVKTALFGIIPSVTYNFKF